MNEHQTILSYAKPGAAQRVDWVALARSHWRAVAKHVLLVAVAVAMMWPFAWMVFASFKTLQDIEGASFFPPVWHPENYLRVFQTPRISFARYYFNSLFVAAWVTFLTCFTSALAAYAFARL